MCSLVHFQTSPKSLVEPFRRREEGERKFVQRFLFLDPTIFSRGQESKGENEKERKREALIKKREKKSHFETKQQPQ